MNLNEYGMTTNELRIGNLFIEGYSGKILEVRGLTKKNITFSGFFKGDWRSEPIQITEEWLVKLGFEKIGFESKVWFTKGDYGLRHTKQGDFVGYIFSMNKEQIKGVRYVHELQNIYFAMTGIEIKLI